MEQWWEYQSHWSSPSDRSFDFVPAFSHIGLWLRVMKSQQLTPLKNSLRPNQWQARCSSSSLFLNSGMPRSTLHETLHNSEEQPDNGIAALLGVFKPGVAPVCIPHVARASAA
eukprot:2652690-Amphidinium_carterae.2